MSLLLFFWRRSGRRVQRPARAARPPEETERRRLRHEPCSYRAARLSCHPTPCGINNTPSRNRSEDDVNLVTDALEYVVIFCLGVASTLTAQLIRNQWQKQRVGVYWSFSWDLCKAVWAETGGVILRILFFAGLILLAMVALYWHGVVTQRSRPADMSVAECQPSCSPSQQRALNQCNLEAQRFSETVPKPLRRSERTWYVRKAFLRDFARCIEAQGLTLRPCEETDSKCF